MRLRVDPVACDAFGYCAELLPERIFLDEWGYPVVDPRPVPPDLLERAREAVRACPRKALRLDPTPVPGGPVPRETPVAPPRRRRAARRRRELAGAAAVPVRLGRRVQLCAG